MIRVSRVFSAGTCPTSPPRRLSWAAAGLISLVLTGGLAAQAPTQVSVPGATNTLTDVPGLRVGHYERNGEGFQTGTTVILTEEGATASYDVQGGGPGTKETDLLVPGGLVT